MSNDDPLPPRRVPDWPQRASDLPTMQYPQSINDTRHLPTLQPVTHVASTPLATPTSGYATAALIAGLATFVTFGLSGVLAVIFGHIATGETRTGQRSGHGMAIAGLILGYLAVAGWVIFLAFLTIGAFAGAGS